MDDRTLRARGVQAQLGDTGALNEVLKAIQHSVLRHVSAMVGGDDRAWDVVQVTLLSIARTIGGLRDPRLFKPWAFRIATRAAVKAVTRDRREELFAEPPEAEAELEVEDPRLDDIRSHALTLPPATRIVIEMHYLDGMKLWEIAESLEVSEGTVKSRLNYGLSRLRKLLGA